MHKYYNCVCYNYYIIIINSFTYNYYLVHLDFLNNFNFENNKLL